MPDIREVREVGRMTDIDGLPIIFYAEGDRVRLEVGLDVAILSKGAVEEFSQIFVSACWEAAQAAGEPSW